LAVSLSGCSGLSLDWNAGLALLINVNEFLYWWFGDLDGSWY